MIALQVLLVVGGSCHTFNYRSRVDTVLQDNPVIDGHNDFPFTLHKLLENNLTGLDFNSDLSLKQPFALDPRSHTDLPRSMILHIHEMSSGLFLKFTYAQF